MTIGPSEFKTVVLVLSPPSRFIRRVDFQGKLFINDDDFRPRECDDGDDCGEFPISVTLEVRPDRPTATHSLQRCVDDEVNVGKSVVRRNAKANQTERSASIFTTLR